MSKECSGCGLPLDTHEIWMDSTGSLYTSEGELLTTGEVLCEYCFDSSYPTASTAFDFSDSDELDPWRESESNAFDYDAYDE